jgi:hypothetical protein
LGRMLASTSSSSRVGSPLMTRISSITATCVYGERLRFGIK